MIPGGDGVSCRNSTIQLAHHCPHRYFSYTYYYTQSGRFSRVPVPHKGAHDALWEIGELAGPRTLLWMNINIYGSTGLVDWRSMVSEEALAYYSPEIKDRLILISKELTQ